MKKCVSLCSVIFVMMICILVGNSNCEGYRHTPDTRNTYVTAFSRVTPNEFATRFNQSVTNLKYDKWMYLGTPVYSDGEYHFYGRSDAGEYHASIYATVDENGYINWLSISTPYHYTVCTGGAVNALEKLITCAAYAVMPNVAYEGYGYNAISSFNLQWAPTQRKDMPRSGVIVWKRLWKNTIMFIDLMHTGPME